MSSRPTCRLEIPIRACAAIDRHRALEAPDGHISLGHTNGSDQQIDCAIAAGARFCTHLGNALTPDAGVENVARFLGLSQDEAHRRWSEAPAVAFGLPAPATSDI